MSAAGSVERAAAGTVPVGFQEDEFLPDLTLPTAVRFSPDGRVFVAEKSGVIKVFDDLDDTTATVFADLRTQVYNSWDRGLLGLALDPGFPAVPYVYVSYTFDYDPAVPGAIPRWGPAGSDFDICPDPPGETIDGCVVSGRVSRLQASGNQMTGGEQVLIQDWCQQFPSHTTGSLEFGADGALYVSGGDGASFNGLDYGQFGDPPNPCGDPPGGSALVLPTAEGGALRSQDLRTASDPAGLDGTILRVDPSTGLAASGNPGIGNPDPNVRRVVAYGFRNPFRFTIRPGTNDLWIGDVGWQEWEEINRIPSPTAAVRNFGWPCYEGNGRQFFYDSLDLDICDGFGAPVGLYEDEGGPAAAVSPFFTYRHNAPVVSGDPCAVGSSSLSGLAFYEGGPYPAAYDGALFFADYSRACIYVMFPNTGFGVPNPANIQPFVVGPPGAVDVQIGPGGDLFYVDIDAGMIRRVEYAPGAPTAVATANPTFGAAPLQVQFNGSSSTDPDPGQSQQLTYAWDLDGDRAFDDSNAAQPSRTYDEGTHHARLRVTDLNGNSDTSSWIKITSGDSPPVVTIDAPAPDTTWAVSDTIPFSASATDEDDGTLPPSALSWSVTLQHCPSNCHAHPIGGFSGATGAFNAPDHEYPSYLELEVKATDSAGLEDSKTISLYPKPVVLTFASKPVGVDLTVDGAAESAPFTRSVIVGSRHSVVAPKTADPFSPDSFSSWSDDGDRIHDVLAPAIATTFTARYGERAPLAGIGTGTDSPTSATTARRSRPATTGAARSSSGGSRSATTAMTAQSGAGSRPHAGHAAETFASRCSSAGRAARRRSATTRPGRVASIPSAPAIGRDHFFAKIEREIDPQVGICPARRSELAGADQLVHERTEDRGHRAGGLLRRPRRKRGVADRQAGQRLGDQPRVGEAQLGPFGGQQPRQPIGHVRDQPASSRRHQGHQLVAALADGDRADHRVRGRVGEEDVQGCGKRGAGFAAALPHRRLDRFQEAVGLAHHVHLRQLQSRPELVVEGLAADPGALGDRRHRHLVPLPLAEQLADGVQHGLAQQRACRFGEARTRRRARSGAQDSTSAAISGLKSTFSRTPQSGQHQSSGIWLHAVPSGNPSRGAPAETS